MTLQWVDEFAAALRQLEAPVPAFVKGPPPVEKRFAVYRNNVYSSLIEAMRAGFPIVEKLVGEEFFWELAHAYVSAHRPKVPMIVFYGEDFGDFIDGFEAVAELPYLGAIARLEYARRKALHAADQPYLDPHHVTSLSQPDLLAQRLHMHPSVSVLRSAFPQFDIWYHNAVDPAGKIAAEGQNVLVSRHHDTVNVLLLPLGAASLMQHLMAGETIADAAEQVMAQNPQVDLSQSLQIALQAATRLFSRNGETP